MFSASFRSAVSLAATYFVFAILLNSVGVVMLQVINNFGVDKTAASSLEGFKDLPIAIVSFLIASSLPRYGYRNAMMTGLALITVVCLITPSFPSFLMTKLLFLSIGVSFALVKVSLYSSIGLITNNSKEHASMLNIIEGIFMIGVLLGYWWFSSFMDSANTASTSWMSIYYYIGGLCLLNLLLVFITPLDESSLKEDEANRPTASQEFVNMLKLLKLPMVYIFVISVFMYVLIEQGVGTWLPTFNNEILKLPIDMSVQATSIYAVCLAIGRLGAGAMMQRITWYKFLYFCLAAMLILIVLVLPLAENIVPDDDMNWLNAPIAAYIFPLIGLVMAPIYPAINSVILSAVSPKQQSSMTGMIVIFSALGGTTGSVLIGVAFENMGGTGAFYLTIIPIIGIMVALFFLARSVNAYKTAHPKT